MKMYDDTFIPKQSDYIRFQAAVALYYSSDFKETEELLSEGEQYIYLSPTLTDEHFEMTMYRYLRTEFARLKGGVVED